MIKRGGEARWVWKKEGVSIFNDRRERFEMILDKDF